jgi:hypothetical protein
LSSNDRLIALDPGSGLAGIGFPRAAARSARATISAALNGLAMKSTTAGNSRNRSRTLPSFAVMMTTGMSRVIGSLTNRAHTSGARMSGSTKSRSTRSGECSRALVSPSAADDANSVFQSLDANESSTSLRMVGLSSTTSSLRRAIRTPPR